MVGFVVGSSKSFVGEGLIGISDRQEGGVDATLPRLAQAASGGEKIPGTVGQTVARKYAGSSAPFTVVFDGTNDWAERAADFAGASDSNLFTISFFVDGITDAGFLTIFGNETGGSSLNRVGVYISGGQVNVGLTNAAGTSFVTWLSDTFVNDGNRHHIVCSFNTAFAAGLKLIKGTVDGVAEGSVTDGSASFNIDLTADNWTVGSAGSVSPVFLLNGKLGELYAAFGQYLDVTTAPNNQKFRNVDGTAADLGSDGSTPTGSAPTLYLSCRTGDPASAFATNRGTGGGLTLHGTLGDGDALGSSGPGSNGLEQAVSGGVGLTYGPVAQTLPNPLTQAASAKERMAGTVAQAPTRLAQAASGLERITGTVADTLPKPLVQAISAKERFVGSVAATLIQLQQAIAASEIIRGTAVQVLPHVEQAAAGTSGTPPSSGVTQNKYALVSVGQMMGF